MSIVWLKSLWINDERLRRLLLIVDIGSIAFWPFLIAFIFAHPAAKGSDGFEIITVLPATMIVLFLSFPALLLLISNRTLRIGALLTALAIIANVWLYSDLRWNSGLVNEWHCSTLWTLCW